MRTDDLFNELYNIVGEMTGEQVADLFLEYYGTIKNPKDMVNLLGFIEKID